MSRKRIAIVTGGSSGIGFSTAKALLNRGYHVYTISRHPFEENGLQHVVADITDEEMVQNAISYIYKREKRIDVLVNCAGMGISGIIEFTKLKDARKQMDVLFFGLVNVNKAVLPVMRRQRRGRIVNISSVAAPIPIPFQAYYSASKAAINSYTMSLANEVRPFGITVTAVMPGDIATNFTAVRKKSDKGDDVYGNRLTRSVARMEEDERNGMKPEEAGAYIASIACRRRVKPLYAIGFQYKLFCTIMKLLPCRLSNWMIGWLYA